MPRVERDDRPSPTVRIGTREIGAPSPPYVIAEIGVNHNGDVATALRMVSMAARAGADAAKFQIFSADALTTASAPTAGYQASATGTASQRDMLRALELKDTELAALRAACDDVGIDFLATPFTVRDVERLARLAPPAVKIASTDANDVLLLEAASQLSVPLIVSTGAATFEDIAATCACLEALDARGRAILLHCVSAYPAPIDELNLRAIDTLAQQFRVPVGFSDHADDARTGAWAVAAGAVVVEKHVTLDRSQAGPDHAMALDPESFRRYVQDIRDVEHARGQGEIVCSPREAEVRAVARKSIVAARPIAAGTVIELEMLTVKRPGTGLAPAEYATLVGRTARTDIETDSLLSWDMVQ